MSWEKTFAIQRTVKDYSYKPSSFRPKKKPYELATFGTELEVQTPNNYRDLSEATDLMLGDKGYLKYDCSIPDKGFEIVTYPFGFSDLKLVGWKKILAELSAGGANSYNNGRCGIHIHVGLNALKNKNWWKVYAFIYKCQEFCRVFGKKDNRNINNYSSFSNYKLTGKWVMEQIKNNAAPSNNSRYAALNFTNFGTVEFRFFRGTLYYPRFWASHLFVDALLHWSHTVSISFALKRDPDDLLKSFFNFAASNSRYSLFVKHIASSRELSEMLV